VGTHLHHVLLSGEQVFPLCIFEAHVPALQEAPQLAQARQAAARIEDRVEVLVEAVRLPILPDHPDGDALLGAGIDVEQPAVELVRVLIRMDPL
jgi:hypothetical protein